MKKSKSRDTPGNKARSLFVWLVVILVTLGSLGLISSIFQDSPKDNSSGGLSGGGENITPGDPNIPEEPEQPVFSFGSGSYATALGVLNYENDCDYSSVTTYGPVIVGGSAENSNIWSSLVSEGENSYVELGKSDYGSVQYELSSAESIGSVYVFETDMKFSGSEYGIREDMEKTYPDWYGRMEFYGDVETDDFAMFRLSFYYSPGEEVFRIGYNYYSDSFERDIPVNEWFNLRAEYVPVNEDKGVLTVYIDGVEIGNVIISSTLYSTEVPVTNNSFTAMKFEPRNYAKGFTFSFDNTYISAVQFE